MPQSAFLPVSVVRSELLGILRLGNIPMVPHLNRRLSTRCNLRLMRSWVGEGCASLKYGGPRENVDGRYAVLIAF